MVVNIEFFSKDFLQNVVTCLKYDVDKVIFIGYTDVMDEGAKVRHKNILKKNAKVREVEFICVDREDMADIKFRLDKAVQDELGRKNEVFFDLTGGEDLVLVAAGIIANKYKLPVKRTDIKKDRVVEYTPVFYEKSYIAEKKREKSLSIEDYIYMQGACINKNAAKDFKKSTDSPGFSKDIRKLWNVRRKYIDKWNLYCMVISELSKYSDGKNICADMSEVREISEKRKLTDKAFVDFLRVLEAQGLVQEVSCNGNGLKYRIASRQINECLCDPGSILELYAYTVINESGIFEECQIGVHIDWDGKIHAYDSFGDVLNEIDLMMIKDNKPVFASCKNGKIDNNVLYELDAVASGLGGKYAKKILISTAEMKDVFRARAKEMNIHIIDESIYEWDEETLKEKIAGFMKNS